MGEINDEEKKSRAGIVKRRMLILLKLPWSVYNMASCLGIETPLPPLGHDISDFTSSPCNFT
jgi:hypothetical protein